MNKLMSSKLCHIGGQNGPNREAGENPGRSRRCEWGRNLYKATACHKIKGRWEGAGSRMIHKPEDLPM
jgi:hypothetical protein